MSILSILGNTSGALAATETRIGVASQNIGNAQNANYVDETASTVTTVGGGEIVNVSRAVNQTLQAELLNQNASNSSAQTLSSFYQQIENLTGSSTGSPVLAAATSKLVQSFQDLATTPESSQTQQEVLSAAKNLVSTVQTLSTGIENLATQTQTQAATDIKSLNSDLNTIASLNQQIVADKSAGRSTSDLENQRDTALSDASQYAPLKTQLQTDGSLSVATPDGVSLVDGTNAVNLKLTPYTLGANGVAGTNAAISIVGDSSNTVLNGSFSSGKIGAELNVLRVDDAGAASADPSVAPLEKARRQLDSFVDQFYSSSATPTAIQSAYNSATGTTGELASNLFIVNNQGAGGSPQPAGSDRSGFALNPALVTGAASIKTEAATAVASALTSNTVSNTTAGDVIAYSGTITGYAQSIATAESTRAAAATSTAQQAATTLSSVQTAYSNATGVSTDQELSNLVVLQNSYNASAKVISVINTIFQSLIGAVQ